MNQAASGGQLCCARWCGGLAELAEEELAYVV
jgi:hypothetical protein